MGSAAEEPEFRRLNEGEIAALPEPRQVAYIAAAREAGDIEAAKTASGVLAYAYESMIRAWVAQGMGGHPDDVEDVVMEVLYSVVRSSFDGKVIGEFVAFVRTIARRRVVDFFRRSERTELDVPFANEHEREDELWGEQLGNEDGTGSVANREGIARVLANRNPMHRKVIRMYGPETLGFLNLSADEVCEKINGDGSDDSVNPANVHQIWKRFKTDLAKELDLDV